MAISAEQLNVILTARDKEFARAMQRSQRQVASFASKSQRDLNKTGMSFSKLGKVAGALTAAFSARAMISAVQSVTQKLDEIGKTADRIGITTDALQLLRATAESAGVAQSALDASIEKLGRGLAEAGMGIGTAKVALDQLNLSADSLIDMGLEDAMGVIADAVNQVPSPMERTALAMQLFGRSGAPMLNLLREGSVGMEEMRRQARELGIVIDEDLIRSAEDAQTQLDLMSRVINANLSTALINIAPLLVNASERIASLAVGVGNFVNQFNRLREVGVGEFAGTASYLDGLEAEAAAAGNVEDQLIALQTQRALILSQTPQFAGDIDNSAVLAAAQALRDALALGTDQEQAIQAQIDFRNELEAALIPVAAQTAQLQEQARLRGLSADQAERARIEAEKEALIVSMMKPFEGQTLTAEVVAAREQVVLVAEEFERAAIAASSVLSPVESIASGTSGAATAAADLADQLGMVAEMSPALSALGFDADNLQSTMQMVESSMESAFMSMVDGTMSGRDAFKSMAAEIIKDLYRILVVKRLVGLITGDVAAMADGSFFSGIAGSPVGAASGRSLQSGQPAVVGEHGRELFVPQTAGRVLSVSQAQNAVGGGGSVTVNQTINVSTGVQQTVRTEIKQLMPQIAESAKAAVVDAKRRGGSYGRAFS